MDMGLAWVWVWVHLKLPMGYLCYALYAEQTLWQAMSSAITVLPLIIALIDFLLETRDISTSQKFEWRALLILDLMMTIFIFI